MYMESGILDSSAYFGGASDKVCSLDFSDSCRYRANRGSDVDMSEHESFLTSLKTRKRMSSTLSGDDIESAAVRIYEILSRSKK